jgi:hypothetical protein
VKGNDVRRSGLLGLLLVLVSLSFSSGAAGEEISLPAVRDVWICGASGRRDTSMSRTQRLRLGGERNYALLDFSHVRLQGMRISKAELFLHAAGSEEEGPEGKVIVSTVSGDWVEGRFSIPYRKDPVGRGATFGEASFGVKPWTTENSTVLSASMGNGNTVTGRAEARPAPGGWWKTELPPRLVHALCAGVSRGICITLESKSDSAGWWVHSRESGKFTPYLRVQADAVERSTPEPPFDLKLEAVGTGPGRAREKLKLAFRVPKGCFGYEVSVGEKPVPRWLIPLAAKAGTRQEFAIPGVPGYATATVNVWAVACDGGVSDAAEVELPGPALHPKKPSE